MSTTTVSSGTVSASTGTISSAGIGSGLNVTAIVSQLMAVEDVPLTNLQTAATGIQTTISAFGAVKSDVAAFQTAAQALADPSTWSATVGTSSDSSSVSVSTSTNAAAGAYAVQVQNLASAQSTVSSTFASSSSLVGSGTLHIDLGTWSANQAGFTAQSGSTGVDITVGASDTLASVVSNINAANAGVTASIVTDATGARLVLTSTTTGAANGFRVTAVDSDGTNTDASGLSALAFDPPNGATTSSITQSGANAQATINGLTVTSSTNTLTNVLQGLTVNLLKATTNPVQLTVAPDTKSMTTAVTNFATAYSSMITLLNTDLAYNASTSTAGPLQGDSTAITLQRQLENIAGSVSTASTAFTTLSQIGVQVQTDGTLTVNSTTLANAMNNPSQLKALFANTDPTGNTGSSANGYAQQFLNLTNSVLGYQGLLTTRVSGLSTSLTQNQTDQSNLQVLLAATQARLQAQYSALDSQMASISSLSSFVTQQITTWNKA